MSAKVTWGHGVLNAMVAPPGGRMIGVGNGYWNADVRSGYSGFNGYGVGASETYFRADSTRTLGAMIQWLTGKSSGANILIVQYGDGNAQTVPSGYAFGNQFCDAIIALGHTAVYTNGPSFVGFEPLDYDMMCSQEGLPVNAGYHGTNTTKSNMDYILANRGKLLVDVFGYDGWCSYYGIAGGGPTSGWHGSSSTAGHRVHYLSDGPNISNSIAPGDWRYQRPFVCDEFGDPGVGGSWGTNYYAIVQYTSLAIMVSSAPPNVMGGTTTLIDCPCEKIDYHGVTGHTDVTGILGLWRA